MPIYEFYCQDCNTIFSFFSRSVNTDRRPDCPKCGKKQLPRRMSMFSVTGRASEEDNEDMPFDADKMEKAMEMLAGEAENINEDDPRQAAGLMRRLSDMTGVEYGAGMQEALARMERGEDPEQIEAEMGDVLENEEPFMVPERRKGGAQKQPAPHRDDTLYDL